MEEAQRPLTVSEVNRAVKTCVERSFPQIWVRGELSDLTVHASGHVYFSLKDATSQLRGAAFRYAQQAQQMRPALAAGSEPLHSAPGSEACSYLLPSFLSLLSFFSSPQEACVANKR